MRTVGLEPDRAEIDADWRRKRHFDMRAAARKLGGTFAEYDEPSSGSCDSPAWTPTMSCCAGGTSTRR